MRSPLPPRARSEKAHHGLAGMYDSLTVCWSTLGLPRGPVSKGSKRAHHWLHQKRASVFTLPSTTRNLHLCSQVTYGIRAS